MPSLALISEYLDELTGMLRFDPRLVDRVRREIEAHLWDAAEGDAPDAQRHAVERFGDVADIASQFIALSAARQIRRTCIALLVATAGVFVAMRGRVAWYAVMPPIPPSHVFVIGNVIAFDRWSFFLALALAMISWAYAASRPLPERCHALWRRQARLGLRLAMLAAFPLLASIVTDLALTVARFMVSASAASAAVSALSILIETLCAAALIAELRRAWQRASYADAMTGRKSDGTLAAR